MANTLNLNTLTVPAPLPFDDKNPTRNFENLCNVLLQMVTQMKSLNFQISDVTNVAVNTGNITIDLSGVEQAIRDLAQENVLIDLGAVRVEIYGKTFSIEE